MDRNLSFSEDWSFVCLVLARHAPPGRMSEQCRARRYKISSQIGTGTFGTVFSARDRTDNSRIAVKVVALEPADTGPLAPLTA